MEEKLTIGIMYATIVVLALVIIIISFVVFYRNRRKSFLKEKQEMTSGLQRELLKAKAEVQEQTLAHFCRELHDNIGQRLSVARIYINKLESLKTNQAEKEELTQISQVLGDAINDMRDAVQTLNPDAIHRFGLGGSLRHELERINRTGLLYCSLYVKGEQPASFNQQQELLLFRICQEFLQNSMKHAVCSKVDIVIDFEQQPLSLQLSDNGKGFDPLAIIQSGRSSGLTNMMNRAKLLGGAMKIVSAPGHGTQTTITLPAN
jgi:signal transduction histidine kinase